MLKAIFRIVIIIAVAALVAGGFWLVVNNTNLVSASGHNDRPPLTEGERPQRPEGMEGAPGRGERGEAEGGRGVLEAFSAFAKLSIIVGLVLLAQKGVAFALRRLPQPGR